MSTPNIFARLTKVDEAKRLIYARAVQETPDHADEIFDYASSKPHFEAWSKSIFDATDGKSFGNIRAMHGSNVAGKLAEPLAYNDDERAIDVCVHVVDDGDWKKTLEGCYTGLSIGGKYVGEKTVEKVDGKDIKRYTAKPHEISLVDVPCIPTATFFDVVKADGVLEKRAFTVTTTAKDGDPVVEGKTTAEKIAARDDTKPAEGTSKYGDVKFADEKNKKYPIDTPAHIRAAWNYINKPANSGKYSDADSSSIKAKIVAAWKDKIDASGPPSADDSSSKSLESEMRAALLIEKPEAQKSLTAFAAVRGDVLEKGMYGVSQLAQLIESLRWCAADAQMEADTEADSSVIPEQLRGVVKELGQILKDMLDEEVEEMNEVMTPPGDLVTVVEMALVGDLEKDAPSIDATLQKVFKAGATYSAATKNHLQSMHDTLTKMVGTGMCEDAAGVNEADKAAKADLQKRADESATAITKLQGDFDALKVAHDTNDRLLKGLWEAVGMPADVEVTGTALLIKLADVLTERNQAIEKVKEWSAKPANGKAILRVVDKAADYKPEDGAKDEIAPVQKADGTVDEGLTLTKKLISGRPNITFND